MDAPILEVANLTTTFRLGGREVAAVRDLDLAVGVGETVALVGASGSGKSTTLAAMIDNHIYWGNALDIDTRRIT